MYAFLILFLIPFKIFAQDLGQNDLNSAIKFFKKNPTDVESYLKLNTLYLLHGDYEKVEKNLSNYTQLKNEYNKIILSPLYYKNKLLIEGSLFSSDSFRGSNLNIMYQRTFKGINKIGFGYTFENRDFLGSIKKAERYTVSYQRKISTKESYEGSFSYSPSNSFLSQYSLLNMYYFSLFSYSSTFVGLRNSKYENRDVLNTMIIGHDYYIGSHILNATAFGTLAPDDFLPSLALSHTYYFDYRSSIKSTFSFGRSFEDISIYSNFRQVNLKYMYKFHNIEPFVNLNFYDSDFRNEYLFGGGFQWNF